MLKDLNYLENNAQIMPQQRENDSDYKTSILFETKAALQTNSSEQTNASKSESAIRRKCRWSFRRWLKKRMEMVQREAGKPAAYFVYVVLIMAGFLMAKVAFMLVAFFKAWRRAVSAFFQHAVSGCRNTVQNSTVGVHRMHTHSVHHEHYSLFTSTDHICACGSGPWRLKYHVVSLLVSASPSLFQSTTTRSTIWTTRPSPRRHCTTSTSSRTYTVDKQR